ncbi:ABC transporter permease subunit [Actinoplanes sp. NEAU-A12]|uniref:ABC transporter permease subunit n=1 Tax=Actinoplanes sandaracinus TaxID=3045177 RepID=A0ABT6WPJ2_9ACTN|nr:ABC transporter permease subunit [Actinoplanes sandaracinus]MDI6101687.1 ABC transporter permease subunit [Actinoplanes sandaracinus]
MTATLAAARRWAALTATIGGLAVLVAALPWLRDDDPARSVLRARLGEREPDPAALAAVRSELDLPAGPVQGAAQWLSGAVTGDLGRSWVDGSSVAETVAAAAGVSALLGGAAAVVAVAVGLLLGAPAAWTAASGRRPRAGFTAAALTALPEFVLAAVLITVVAVNWRLAPTAGWFGPSYLVLPALALGIPTGGLLARLLITAVEATAAEPWVHTWRAAGSGRGELAAALLRRAVTVVVTQVAVLFVGLLGGAVAVEQLFAIPGLGRIALHASLAQDLPLVQGCVLLLVIVGVAVGGLGIAVHRLLLGPAGAAASLIPAVPAHRRRGRRVAPIAAATLLLGVVVAGLLRDADRVRLGARLTGPSWAHPLGADPVGRDVLAQLGHGAVLTVGTAAAVTVVSLLAGLTIGLRGGAARAGAADILNALPPVFVGLVVAAILSPGLAAAALAAALVAWVPLGVHTRGLAEEVRASGYYRAAELCGAGPGRLLRRHLLPAVAGPVVLHALARVPATALTIAGLGFLGLGAGHDSPEWGAQLATAVAYLERAPLAVLGPVAGLGLLGVLAAAAPTASPAGSRSGTAPDTGRGETAPPAAPLTKAMT